MEKYQTYSVLITDEKGRRGTGTLFYKKEYNSFYIFTCAHVIYTSNTVTVNILKNNIDRHEKFSIEIDKSHFHFSPIDEAHVTGNGSNHTLNIAIIDCPIKGIELMPTNYFLYPMSEKEQVLALGYPESNETNLYYQQDELLAKVFRVEHDDNYFIIAIDDKNINAADRIVELEGYSGAPIWDKETLEQQDLLLGGLITAGVGNNANGGRIKVMSSSYIKSLMKDEFGINMEMRIPSENESNVAPGYEGELDIEPITEVRSGWIENERRKAKAHIDALQLQKAIDSCRKTIKNPHFSRCDNKQKYSIFNLLRESYRLSRDYDVYDRITEEMHNCGVFDCNENLMDAVRYYEALDDDRAEECINKALEENPNGNKERILSMAIKATKYKDVDIFVVDEFIGSRDELFVKPENIEEEQLIYQTIGYVLSNVFHETTRAIRCLNRAYNISNNYLILETLGLIYYQHAMKDAFVDDTFDKVDIAKINLKELDKARDILLRVISTGDEMWLKGTFERAGLVIFKCFYFSHDNFRIYKHYRDLMKYTIFPNLESKRDVQICYIEATMRKEPLNLNEFDSLKDSDKKYFELLIQLDSMLKEFNDGFNCDTKLTETSIFNSLIAAEKSLQQLIEVKTDDRLSFDAVHIMLAKLYGIGIMKFSWQAINEVKFHVNAVVNNINSETLTIFVDELQSNDLAGIEKRYETLFEKYKSVITFTEWCNFYIRHKEYEKAKLLYDSVLQERNYLIEAQPEFFYRMYINYVLSHRFDLTPVIDCFINKASDFKDPYIYTLLEMDLNFATCVFNNPDVMLANAKSLLNEGLYTKEEYEQKCLIINMLNLRKSEAEKHACWNFGIKLEDGSMYDEMFYVYKGACVKPNPNWNGMKNYQPCDLFDAYKNETWLRNPVDILNECKTSQKKEIVVDLWTIYSLEKSRHPEIMAIFDTVYVTHQTISLALQEIYNGNDDDIRRALYHLENESNVKILSPTLNDQLEIREEGFNYEEVHSACLLAQKLKVPALVSEFRVLIPKKLQSNVIRPTNLGDIVKCIKKLK